MFDYWQKAEKQLEVGDCEKAIEYSIQSFNEGLKWLWIDNDSLTEKDVKKLWNIQATYTNIHKAYECKADKLYDLKNYSEALYYQFKADSFLNLNPVAKNDYWKAERADSKNNIGIYYDALGESDSAISYYTKAIIYHADSIKSLNLKLATYMSNLSSACADARYWNESNQAAEQSIMVLDKDSISQDKNEKYSISYLQLVYNALSDNNPFNAGDYLHKVEPYLTSKWECKYYLYRSILSNNLDNHIQTLNLAEKARICYGDLYGQQYQNIAESHSLSYDAWMQIPNYDSALAHLKKGIEITGLNYASTSARYHDYVKKEGYYHYSLGDYNQSLKKLLDVKRVYEQQLGSDSDKLPEVLATVGRIKIEQGAFDEARNYAKESMKLAEQLEFFIDNRASNLINDLAYINYATNQVFVADTLYKKSIELSLEADKDSSLSVASALNGLALISMRKSRFLKADSLFNQSLQLYKLRNSELHPDIGIILMNKSELSLKLRNFNDALQFADQALENFTPFHRNSHPTIADMYFLKASILNMNDERTLAYELLTKALEIYESNFQPEHMKIVETRNRLGAIDNRR
ncbi:MAG: tetratricopeptide repeat protein [Cyclobacteriaceae bacterium]